MVIQSLTTEKYWREYWTIYKAGSEGLQQDEIICDEFLYSPKLWENQLKETGFKILEIYGDLFGTPFDEESSWRRVSICQKS